MKSATARMQEHQNGMSLLHDGHYPQARQVFEKALADHGPHIGLLADLALASYLEGNVGLFLAFTERLESEFQKLDGLISRDSRIRTHVTLAKFFEEAGRIADAFDHINSALALIEPGEERALHVQCQQLRLLVSFGKEEEVAELYAKCLRVSESTPNVMIECFHALLLAETRIFGIEVAWPRLESLKQHPDLQAADMRLFIVDMMEAAIEKKNQIALQKLVGFLHEQNISNLDAYERAVVGILHHGKAGLNTTETFLWSRQVVPHGYMRLMALALITQDAKPDPLLQKQFLMQILSYEHRTQKILQRKWGLLLEASNSNTLVVEIRGTNLIFNDQALSFQKSPQSLSIIEILSRGEVDPHQMLEQLSMSVELEQNLETLRISLLRLNKKISAFLGIPWFLKFRKTGIVLNSQIHLRKRDDT